MSAAELQIEAIMFNSTLDIVRLDNIIKKTVAAISDSKAEINDILESASQECRELEEVYHAKEIHNKERRDIETRMEETAKTAEIADSILTHIKIVLGYFFRDHEELSILRERPYTPSNIIRERMKEYNLVNINESVKSFGNCITAREVEVIGLIAEGMKNKEIAKNLYISEKTVKNHVYNLLKKLNVSDRTQLAIYALKQHSKGL